MTADLTCDTCANRGFVQVCGGCSLQPQQPRANRYRRDVSLDCPECQAMKAERDAVPLFKRPNLGFGSGPRYCGGDACRKDPAWEEMD